ncbi:multidrug transporter [Phaeobacter inhibens]|nr:multidrug transporter [Phaeobacter inhibens]
MGGLRSQLIFTGGLIMPLHYLYLVLAVAAETIGTTALQASQQFTRLGPSLLVVVGYGLAFYLMALTLRHMPVGIVYAIWSGLGIFLIAIIGWVVFGQRLDLPAVLGLLLILAGILVIHLFSNTAGH